MSVQRKSETVVQSTIRLWDAEEREQIQALLEQKITKENISTRAGPGGAPLSYIETWKAIELANKAFGFNGWSSAISELNIDFLEQGAGGKWCIGLSAVVRVTLKDGTFHEDVGYACLEQKNKGQLIDFAKKSAVSDGLKRALRHFGNALGLTVYDKEHLKAIRKVVKAPAPAGGSSSSSAPKPPAATLAQTAPSPAPTAAPTTPQPTRGQFGGQQRQFGAPPPPPPPQPKAAVVGSPTSVPQFGVPKPQSPPKQAPPSAVAPLPPAPPAVPPPMAVDAKPTLPDFSDLDDSFLCDWNEADFQLPPAAPTAAAPAVTATTSTPSPLQKTESTDQQRQSPPNMVGNANPLPAADSSSTSPRPPISPHSPSQALGATNGAQQTTGSPSPAFPSQRKRQFGGPTQPTQQQQQAPSFVADGEATDPKRPKI